jgi:hypothetical protein
MALFDRRVPQESRAADKVYELIIGHLYGVTFNELMQLHPDHLSDRSSVLSAINLLREEGKLTSDQPWQGEDYLNTVKLYAKPSR